MKAKRFKVIAAFVLITVSLVTIASCSQKQDELTGTWVLTYDPDSPDEAPDDMMIFKSNDKVDLSDSESVYLSGTYKKYEEKVVISCNVKGKTKTLEMTFSPDNRKVLMNSSGAEYTKQ